MWTPDQQRIHAASAACCIRGTTSRTDRITDSRGAGWPGHRSEWCELSCLSKETRVRKKAGLVRARLEVLAMWGRHNHLPRGITELSRHWRRGTMRNANAQCANTMIRVGALRQPPAPHVSHAETGGRLSWAIAKSAAPSLPIKEFKAPLEQKARISA